MLKSHGKFQKLQSFLLPKSNNNVCKLLKNINAHKAIGCDLIPPKLLKIAADQFAEPLTYIINSVITQSFFPNKAKEASITPAGEGGNDKHTFSKYRK